MQAPIKHVLLPALPARAPVGGRARLAASAMSGLNFTLLPELEAGEPP